MHLCIKVFTAKVPKANDNLISMQLCNCESSKLLYGESVLLSDECMVCDVVCTMIMTLEYTFTLITNWLACLSLLFRMTLEKEYINLFSYNEIL